MLNAYSKTKKDFQVVLPALNFSKPNKALIKNSNFLKLRNIYRVNDTLPTAEI